MIDWNALIIAAAIFAVFLFLTNLAGKSFHSEAQKLRNSAVALRKERHRMISERHLRDKHGNYVHGDPVWDKSSREEHRRIMSNPNYR